jgi:prolyl oligopeptidase
LLQVTAKPPHTPIEPVTEVLHGVSVTDPYRWLEDQESPRTRGWLTAQTHYARAYLDALPDRERIGQRIRELVDVETYDSIQKIGNGYVFRKRVPGQEQPCIFLRQGPDGEDQLLVDPAERGGGRYIAVKPIRVSGDGRLLLYEVKEGGERTGKFELLEIGARRRLDDALPRGYLRGFAFAPDGKSFYYSHEALGAERPSHRAAYQHFLGAASVDDREVFFAGDDPRIRLAFCSNGERIVFLVYRFLNRTMTDIYWKSLRGENPPQAIVRGIECSLGLQLSGDRIFAITDRDAPNRRIVELRARENGEHEWIDVVPVSDRRISSWLLVQDRILVSYLNPDRQRICLFDLSGREVGEMQLRHDETVRMVWGSPESDEVLIEKESLTQPLSTFRYSAKGAQQALWARRVVPFDSATYGHSRFWYASKDGTEIPMLLAGRRDVLDGGSAPTIMTAYGGYGVPAKPQFSILVAFLMERGCLFGLPSIRGGSELGAGWHLAAKRRHRQIAYDDFLSAAEWLIGTGRTVSGKLAIFGGSNSGLLVSAVLTQRPDLFAAVVCMVPITDMLRYHLFDNAYVWRDEFGAASDPEDFAALNRYSPYHQVRPDTPFPATMIVSGDADQCCNSLHSRKMTARLQAASISRNPIFLDYSKHRGHSPALPLTDRVGALTDRAAFLCDRLNLAV